MNNFKFILCLLAISAIGCKKDYQKAESKKSNLSTPAFSYSKPSNSSGILVFADTSSFKGVMNYLINKDETLLNHWEDSLGFISLRSYWNEIEENWIDSFDTSDPNDTTERKIDDDYLATILNSENKVRIGDTIYEVQYDHYNVFDTNSVLLYTNHISLTELNDFDTASSEGLGKCSSGCDWSNTSNDNWNVTNTGWYF